MNCSRDLLKNKCSGDRTQIKGIVNKKGFKRTSDLFTEDDSPFITVYKAITKGQENKVLAVNKTQIIWAELEDDGDS